MIRVGLVVHRMEPGGIERSVARIASGLDRDQFEPVVICLDRSGAAARWLPEDVPVIEVRKRSGNDWRAVKRLAMHLREQEIDIVQSHNWGTLVETAVARKLSRVAKHIHAERGTVLGKVSGGGWKHRIRAMVMRTTLRSVDAVMSNAHSVAKRVEDRSGFPARSVIVIPNGVPVPTSQANEGSGSEVGTIRGKLGVSEKAMLIGSVGRLHPVKGFDVLIEALAGLTAENLHLVILGDGEQAPSLAGLSKKLGVASRVHFAGHQDELAPWYSSMDIYVNSSHSEGMSQSIVEAMSLGLPIVATDVGDARQMINKPGEHCGVICPPNDPKSLGDAIAKLAHNGPMRKQFSCVAREHHKRYYSAEGFIGSMESLYRGILRNEPIGFPCNSIHADNTRAENCCTTDALSVDRTGADG